MQLRDRELPGGHVVEQREQDGQRVVVRVLRDGQEKDLRVEVAQRTLEVAGLPHAHDALEAERVRLVPHREIGLDDDGVSGRPLGVEHPTEVEEREPRRDTHRIRVRERRERIGALLLGGTRAGRVRHLDDERDAVSLRDRLAQLGHGRGS